MIFPMRTNIPFAQISMQYLQVLVREFKKSQPLKSVLVQVCYSLLAYLEVLVCEHHRPLLSS